MNYAKHKYESLILLYNRLCKSSKSDYLEIIQSIAHDLNDIKRYNLFPLDFSDEFHKTLSKEKFFDFEKDKLTLAKELYIYLAKMMFSFSLSTSSNLNLYAHVLELGRTEFSQIQAFGWGKEYIDIEGFQDESVFFKFNQKKILLSSSEAYDSYYNSLRKESFERVCDFKEEESLPDDIVSKIKCILEDDFKQYQDYIESNYSHIKKAFSAYNKSISVYLQGHLDSAYLVMINMYEAVQHSINVYPYNVSLMYRFSNVEAIDSKMSNSILAGFKSPEYKNLFHLFSINSIHHELNRIFVRYASFEDMRDYLLYILRGQLKKVSVFSDNEIEIDDEKCLLLFDNVPTVNAFQELLDDKRENGFKYIAFRSQPDDSIKEMLKDANISIIDVMRCGMSLINNQNGDMIHWFMKSRLSNLQIDDSYRDYSIGDVLIKKLENCPKGKDGWSRFEEIGGEIFNYLFADSFRNYTYTFQSTTTDGIFRRDMVVNNTYKESPCFWQLVKEDYNSNLIIIDFKNYQHTLTPDEFYNPSKYMNKLAGNFVIILSRYGLNESAKKFQIKLLEDNKLVMCLSDANLKDLINQKINGQNPLYNLENMYYTLCKNR